MTRPTLMQRINRRLAAQRNGEGGLALLDVLLGMAIFALIAVIAVQAMGQFRQRAFITQATSDAKQAGTAVEAAMTEPNATFAGVFGLSTVPTTATLLTAAQKTALGVNSTGANRIYLMGAAGMNETNYVLCVDNGASGQAKSIRYTAATGAIGAPANARCA